MRLRWFEAVSYTHLDVYKRQLMFRIIADEENPNLSEYKHLLKTLDCASESDTFWWDEIAKL